MDCRTLDASNLARRYFDHFGLEAVRLDPAQVHAQDHFCPILCFGTSRTGLNIDKRIVRIHVARKHTPKLERRELLFEFRDVLLNFADRRRVVFVDCEHQELTGIIEPIGELIKNHNNLFELRPLLAKGLGTVGLIPYIGLFEFALDLGQTFSFAFIVKGTSSTRWRVQQGR